MRGNLASRPDAENPHISASHSNEWRSRRFMPAPSPMSTDASSPARSDVRNELSKWTRTVSAYASGSSRENFIICAAAKRSTAGDPVRSRSNEPKRPSRAATSFTVEESIQIGDSLRENHEASTAPPFNPHTPASDRHTVACCCAHPPTASILPMEKPVSRNLVSASSSPRTHICGSARRIT